MRALVVLPFPLSAEGSAAARCAVGLLAGLAAHGVQASALSLAGCAQPITPSPADIDNEEVRLPIPSASRARWHRLVDPYGGPARTRFGARLRALAAGADVVHLNGPFGASLLPLVPGPAVVQLDNLMARDRDIGAPWKRESRIAIELWRAERRTCRRAEWLLANASEVAAPLSRAAPHADVSVAPLSLDPAYYVPRATLTEPTAGLIGLARWPPTANAVRRLMTRVWPRVLQRRPDARLLLAGTGMERDAFPELPVLPGVEWLGHVSSAAEFVRSLGVLVYPLDRGSGTKVKVLEALALGVPVVTTPLGAEGIIGRQGIVAETSDDALADAVRELLDDPAARRIAADAAHETFLAQHSPAVATEPVVALYERMLARAATPSAPTGRRHR